MRRFVYPARLMREADGQYTVLFRDLPEAITCGMNRADSVREAADCLEEAIAGRIADGLDVPPPSPAKGRDAMIPLSGAMAAKASLYLAMREAGLSQAELARRLGVDEKEVRRMLDPRHATKLPRIEQALNMMGKRLVISLDSQAA